MAKLQIFVFALILAQGYCVSLTNLPASISPQANEQPICVTYVKLLLQSIIDKLSNLPSLPQEKPQPEIEVIVPQPEDPEIPEVIKPQPEDPEIPEVIKPQPEVTEPQVTEPEAKPEAKNPCTACFNYLTVLITSAQKAAAARKYPVIALY